MGCGKSKEAKPAGKDGKGGKAKGGKPAKTKGKGAAQAVADEGRELPSIKEETPSQLKAAQTSSNAEVAAKNKKKEKEKSPSDTD